MAMIYYSEFFLRLKFNMYNMNFNGDIVNLLYDM